VRFARALRDPARGLDALLAGLAEGAPAEASTSSASRCDDVKKLVTAGDFMVMKGFASYRAASTR